MSDSATDRAPANNLLARLRPEDFALIAPSLEPRTAIANHVLYDPGDDVGTVYFPLGHTLVSFMVCTEGGDVVETVSVGREGAVGGIVSEGRLPAFTRMMVQTGGELVTLPVPVLNAAKQRSSSVNSVFARYADCLLAQIFQSTACNAVHSIEQRTAKWIVAASERMRSERLPITQERLAAMLGVGRSYISRLIGELKRAGLLDVRRGALVLRDVDGLRRRACSCNEIVKAHHDTVLAGLYPEG